MTRCPPRDDGLHLAPSWANQQPISGLCCVFSWIVPARSGPSNETTDVCSFVEFLVRRYSNLDLSIASIWRDWTRLAVVVEKLFSRSWTMLLEGHQRARTKLECSDDRYFRLPLLLEGHAISDKKNGFGLFQSFMFHKVRSCILPDLVYVTVFTWFET